MIKPGDKIKLPDKDIFELSDKDKRLLQNLFDWQERSKNTYWVLGEPLEV